MKTAVVILNWNTRSYLEKWLPALCDSCRSEALVAVADNASSDGSLDYVREAFPDVLTMSFSGNLGFTGGYNRALGELSGMEDAPAYAVLINSDVLVSEGWLQPLVEWMDGHPECAACGPKILSMSEPDRFEYAGAAGGYVDRFGYPFCRGRVLGRTSVDDGRYDGRAESVLWVSGACMMVRMSAWNALGGLDDRFFAHMEEIDFCWRAALEGYSVTLVPSSRVYHLGAGTLSKESPLKLKLNFRNNLLLLDNNLALTAGPCRAASRIAIRRILDAGSAMVYLISGRYGYFKAVFEAHREFDALKRKDRKVKRARTSVSGYQEGICILIQAVLRGRGIFNYLDKYENSHRRCR